MQHLITNPPWPPLSPPSRVNPSTEYTENNWIQYNSVSSHCQTEMCFISCICFYSFNLRMWGKKKYALNIHYLSGLITVTYYYLWPWQKSCDLRTAVLFHSASFRGLPWWLSGKESTCQCKRCRFDPWVRKIPWRRKWQPSPVFLPGKSHGQRNLVGYSPWG